MIRVKYILAFCGMTFLFVSFSNCGSSQTAKALSFVEAPPFSISEIFSQKWAAGVQEGGSGTNLHITFESISEDVSINEIYFRGKTISATQNPNLKLTYLAAFRNEMKPDVIMDRNPVNEAKNTPPEEFPFDLKDNEAVISFTHNGVMSYFKALNILEKPLIAYPSTNPNGID